jgi:hypothetical protein
METKMRIALMLMFAVFLISPASASRLCEGAVSKAACHSHLVYLSDLSHRVPALDTSPDYMKAKDPRYNNAMIVGGGGNGSGQ